MAYEIANAKPALSIRPRATPKSKARTVCLKARSSRANC